MAKGKRELIIEVNNNQIGLNDLKKLLDKRLKEDGFKYSSDVKMYFNTDEKIVYCVDNLGNKTKVVL